MELSYILYDTALFGTTPNVTFPLFQISEGGDATHTPDFTNSRGSGMLPSTEKFLARKIMIQPESNMVEADVDDWFVNGYLRVFLANQVVFQSPILPCIFNAGYIGTLNQAAAANRAFVGRLGDGYKIMPELLIPGGVAFKVELTQGIVIATANTRIKFMIEGQLTR